MPLYYIQAPCLSSAFRLGSVQDYVGTEGSIDIPYQTLRATLHFHTPSWRFIWKRHTHAHTRSFIHTVFTYALHLMYLIIVFYHSTHYTPHTTLHTFTFSFFADTHVDTVHCLYGSLHIFKFQSTRPRWIRWAGNRHGGCDCARLSLTLV